MPLSPFHLIEYTFKTYVIICTLLLITSYSEHRLFFILSMPSLFIFKIINLNYLKSERDQQEDIHGKANNPLVFDLICLFTYRTENIRYTNGENKGELIIKYTIAFILFLLYQEIIIWTQILNVSQITPSTYTSSYEHNNQLFYQSSLPQCHSEVQTSLFSFLINHLTNNLSLFHIFYIAQLFCSLFLKSTLEFYYLRIQSQSHMKKQNYLQILSLFLNISSLHGLFAMSYFLSSWNYFMILIAIKLSSVLLEVLIICKCELYFIYLNRPTPMTVGQVLAFTQLVINAPIDYSPFFNKLEDGQDIEYYLSMDSFFIVRIFQSLEIVYLLFISITLQSAGLGYETSSGSYFLNILIILFQISTLLSLGLQCYDTLGRKRREIFSNDYFFYYRQKTTVDELIKVLENSENLEYLEVTKITDMRPSQSEQNLDKQRELLQKILKQIHTKIFIYLPLLMDSTMASPNYLILRNGLVFRTAFFELLFDHSIQIPYCQFNSNKEDVPFSPQQLDRFPGKYQKDRITLKGMFYAGVMDRIAATGITKEIEFFLKIQNPIYQRVGKTAVNYIQQGIVTAIIFHRELSPYFNINPVMILHDLLFIEE